MSAAIAIVGMACCYADARSPQELWENVLARRRAFRRLPAQRLCLGDYFSADPETPDSIYASQAALIDGYEFDRVRFRVAGPIFRSVDLAHWLALDVAAQALDDAGFVNGDGLPVATTGVLLGNTLTGEFSRAATLRLRWPYVRRVVETRLRAEGWDDPRRLEFLRDLEDGFKAPFAPVGEETLAGALSNTIAGRICNHFHLGGGGYTLDGACCSSLLAVARACSALEAGEIDVALAGGVDLSLDPFELVGFAKAGALARGEMLVYDCESSGFLPGEGSGFVVLMREADAQAQRRRTYGIVRGWGISSDGAGSITRPEVRGQTLALERAYQRAGYGAETVALFEGHGTGTPVGDAVELQALTAARHAAGAGKLPAAIGSIKANIGHTKAAAGVAGLIKASLAVHHQVLPPATGVRRPRPELEGDGAALRVAEDAEPWPEDQPLRAGVNSFGFGGINVHVTIEGGENQRAAGLSSRQRLLAAGAQDAELFLFAADSRLELARKLERASAVAPGLSYAELSDASVALAGELVSAPWRAAVVAATPSELAERFANLRGLLDRNATRHIDCERGTFMSAATAPARIGFLFPGQASPVRLDAGAHGRRFPRVRELYRQAGLPAGGEVHSTRVAQIAIASAELAGLRLLSDLGIEASVAVGHSLGELAAYCWAGAIDEASLLALVHDRGRYMAELPGPPGAMASISADASQVRALIAEDGGPVVIACFNASAQIVVAGESVSVARLASRAQARGWSATLLPAAHAFHSPLMVPAVEPFRKAVHALKLQPLSRRVISTITGAELPKSAGLPALLIEQLTAPVRFAQALDEAAKSTDFLIEVGPGNILTHLANARRDVPAISLDVAGPSLTGVLQAAAAAHVLGASLRTEALFQDRFTRPFDFERQPSFFVNPCELAPAGAAIADAPRAVAAARTGDSRIAVKTPAPAAAAAETATQVVRTLIARRTELPPEAIQEDAHLLRDLHLNSIVVGELVAAAARQLGMAPPRQLLEFADATVGQTAKALERLRATAKGAATGETNFPGVDEWTRAFIVDWSPRSLRRRSGAPQPPGPWRVFARNRADLVEALSRASLPGSGVIVCLSPGACEEQAEMLLQAAQESLAGQGRRYFVLIGAASVAAAFARTLHLEDPGIATRTIEAPLDSRIIDIVREEVTAAAECVEVRYDENGHRTQLCLRLLEDSGNEDAQIPLGPGDVALVSGGGKGIVAACSLMLARETGASLVILGRSQREDDVELAAHLEKLTANGVKAKYISCDVTGAPAVGAAIGEAAKTFGRVTAIIHGAGHNHPRLLGDLDRAALERTLAPKVQGLRNLLAAVDCEHLRLLVTFGSVIGRAGLRGQADYALANACQSRITEEFAREHPACRCLAFESSAWSGVGMAERLGTVESLRREGIATVSPEQGVAWLRRLLSRQLPAVSVVVTGRLGANPPLPMDAPPLPLLRFLEKPRVHYPGVELVADAELTTASDPYLMDHVFETQPLLPGVMALEAMTQAAMAVAGESRIPALSDVRFERSVVVEPGARVTMRVAALVRRPGCVEVVVRSSQTSFQIDHFRCVCQFGGSPLLSADAASPPGPTRLAVDPERDLYGKILFQNGRFRCLAGYRFLNARSCWAEIAPGARQHGSGKNRSSPNGFGQHWFSQYLPSQLVLGNPAARDAALHAVQACVPHAVLLPIGVKRLYLAPLRADQALLAHARRRWRKGKTYCYDVELRTEDGTLRERWEELQLRQIADAATRDWPDPLVAAFLEWRVEETIPAAGVAAAFDRDHDLSLDRRSRSERAIQKALNSPEPVRWRADGKPEVQAPLSVSAAHSDGLTLAVAGPCTVACDLEPVRPRTDQAWRDLLGRERWSLAELIASEAGEDVQTAATRVWTALESLKKAEAPCDAPLVLLSCSPEKQSCVSLAASGMRIATAIVQFRGDPTPFAVSVLARSDECVTTNTGTALALKRPTLPATSTSPTI